MKRSTFTLISNRPVARGTFELVLRGDCSDIRPGRFVEVKAEGFFLRRPFSVCDCLGDTLTLVCRVSGTGTEAMSRLRPGASLDVLTGLGNGFDLSPSGDTPLLLGGGTGLTPLYYLCRALVAQGKRPRAALGFASAADVFYAEKFTALGAELTLMTDDGSAGEKGLVTEALARADYSYVYACGPLPMLRAAAPRIQTGAQFSLEARMGCGFGACMGCTIQTLSGPKRVCRDGPVFLMEELPW